MMKVFLEVNEKLQLAFTTLMTTDFQFYLPLTSTNFGDSPGACVVDITVKADKCAMARTVAAQIHGPPTKAPGTFRIDNRTTSQWSPLPFLHLSIRINLKFSIDQLSK